MGLTQELYDAVPCTAVDAGPSANGAAKGASGASHAELRKKLWPGLKNATELVVSRARGSELFTKDGARYLDFSSGIGVVNTGHNHPKVVAAVRAQAECAIHLQMSTVVSDRVLELIDRMQPHLPRCLDSFFFANTGAEAVENAMRLARQTTGRDAIIAFQGGFHGRTAATLAVTTSAAGHRGTRSGPQLGCSYFAPYPYAYHGVSEDFALEQLELLLRQQVQASDVAAVLIEPVLGDGGYVVAPPAFMRALRAFCDRNGFLLICDEVQCGYGRTGKMFAIEHSGVVPDMLITAKGLASGFPLSAVIARSEVTAKQAKGCVGGTYGGNTVACAAAVATLDVFEQEGVLENANARSAQAFEALRALQREGALIGDVRGQGLMIGVEFEAGYPGIAGRVMKKCLERGMIVLTASAFETLRLIPPLTITEVEMAEGMSIFRESVLAVAAEYKPQAVAAASAAAESATPHARL